MSLIKSNRLLICLICLGMHATVAFAAEYKGFQTQGGFVIGQTVPGAKVTYKGRTLRVSATGLFIVGFGRNEAAQVTVDIRLPDGKRQSDQLTVQARQYREERIDSLPKNKVSPSAAEWKRIIAEQVYFDTARARNDDRTDFTMDFIWPAKGRISGVYGSRRILNGIPKNPHTGLDIAAPEGTKIVAPIDGVVTLVQQDLFYTGGTLFIHHGHGLSTMYIHLSEIFVKEGQEVKQGDVIAAIGMTGRATGPHLHWGMNWFNTKLDPQLVLKQGKGKRIKGKGNE